MLLWFVNSWDILKVSMVFFMVNIIMTFYGKGTMPPSNNDFSLCMKIGSWVGFERF